MDKQKGKVCDESMTFSDCELAILREAVSTSEEKQARKIANTKEIAEMITILENFLRRKQLICYGGTAINNILPKQAQFYNRDTEVPDYDFYSSNALDDAKELADLFNEHGFDEIDAKAGVHFGTYKVFVNFIPIADITFLHPVIFKSIRREAIQIDGILYAPPNFLRMNMYLEISRPDGDVSWWENIYKRLVLLNKYYPFTVNMDCNNVQFQRKMEHDKDKSADIYYKVRDALVDEGVVFFGGYAARLYSTYMSANNKEIVKKIPDFDVLAEDPDRCANILMERLRTAGHKNVKKIRYEPIGEIIPERIEIRVGVETLAFIYKPIACHSYNVITIDNREIKVATIDTMLSLYFAFYYSDDPYYAKDRILCMSKFLFDIEYKNRQEQKGLLQRFSINCYGTQPTMESIRAEKMEKFKELKDKRGTREYDEWFLKYSFSTKDTEKAPIKDRGNNKMREKIKDKGMIKVKRVTYSKNTKFKTTRKKQSNNDYLY